MKTTILCSLSGLLILAASVASAVTLPEPLVDTAWLKQNLSNVTVLSVRADTRSFTTAPMFMKDRKTGRQQLTRVGGHIPGARLVDYKRVRSERIINGKKAIGMMPTQASFESLMQSAGLNKNSTVIIVSKGEDNGDMTMATRLYWQLKVFAQDRLAILDGGLANWLVTGGTVDTTAIKPVKGNWQAGAVNKALLASSDEVAAAVKTGTAQLVDTRSLGLYLGTYKKPYVFARGHISGAKPFANELLTQPGAPATFTPGNEFRNLMQALEIDGGKDIITYCNSGHLASGSWFVFSELMGNKNVKLYDGSMHQWTLENRPVTAFKME